jgi:hypothetical protein
MTRMTSLAALLLLTAHAVRIDVSEKAETAPVLRSDEEKASLVETEAAAPTGLRKWAPWLLALFGQPQAAEGFQVPGVHVPRAVQPTHHSATPLTAIRTCPPRANLPAEQAAALAAEARAVAAQCEQLDLTRVPRRHKELSMSAASKLNFYDFKANTPSGAEVSMADFKGKATLIVNVASF